MTYTKTQKREMVEELGPDVITFGRDGVITAKWGYFYRHGRTAEYYRDRVVKELPVEIVEYRDDWKQWPKDSYFVVRFRWIDNYERTYAGLHAR